MSYYSVMWSRGFLVSSCLLVLMFGSSYSDFVMRDTVTGEEVDARWVFPSKRPSPLLKLTFDENDYRALKDRDQEVMIVQKDEPKSDVTTHKKVVVCYLGTWATYRPNDGSYDLEKHFDTKLCTHLIYSFAGLDNKTNALKPLDPFLDLEENYGRGWYKKAVALKQKNPRLRVLLAVGGWNEGSESYSKMAMKPETRRTFIDSAMAVIRKYGFDGLDMDWEYPARRSGTPQDKKNFVTLLKEFRQEFDKYGLLLTAAVGATQAIAEESYDLPELSKVLDQIHLMCYDYFGSWDAKTYHNAPMNSSKGIGVAASIEYYLAQGVSPNKLVLGLPMYGRTFLLKNPQVEGNGLGEDALPAGFQGPYTREDGFLGYNEICKMLAADRGDWTTHWDSDAQVPYMRNGAKWVSFDNPSSIIKKISYALTYELKGAMVWSIDTDDFTGECDLADGANPLLRAVNFGLTHGKTSAGNVGPSQNTLLSLLPTAALFLSTSLLIASQL